MKTLLIAGAGTSIELGVPGMFGLAEGFVQHAQQWSVEADLVQQLLGDNMDIEYLIEEVDKLSSARKSLALLERESVGLGRIDKIRAEVEWFVQHVAERVLPRSAQLMWGSVLRNVRPEDFTIVTTNYDRAIELAANSEGVVVDDGFGSFGMPEIAEWRGFQETRAGIPLVKLHGSTDWYVDNSTRRPTKLRHPMPLFGHATLRLPSGRELGSALILPSREKLLSKDPYPRLSQAFLNASDSCELGIIVGSSLRDSHLRGAVQVIAMRVPTFIVNPEGDTLGIEGAIGVAQSAGAFLVGTLPKCLVASDPATALVAVSQSSHTAGHTLEALRIALDTNESSQARCRALEELDSCGSALDANWIRELLNGGDPYVARYALGLIPVSIQPTLLAAVAAQSPHCSESAYLEDLKLLEGILAS